MIISMDAGEMLKTGIEAVTTSEANLGLKPESEVRASFANTLTVLKDAIQPEDPTFTKPAVFTELWLSDGGKKLQEEGAELDALLEARKQVLGATEAVFGIIKGEAGVVFQPNEDDPPRYHWQTGEEKGIASLGQLRLGLEIVEETGIDAQQKQQAETARQALEQCMYNKTNRPYAETRVEVEQKAREILGVDEEGWQTIAPEKKLAVLAQAEQNLGLEYKLRGLKETSAQEPVSEESLTDKVKEQANWDQAQIKAIAQLVASLDLTDAEKLKAADVFTWADNLETPPPLTQVLSQLEAIGIQPGQKLPEEASQLTPDQKSALQGIIDSNPALKDQGMDATGLHQALLDLAKLSDKRRQALEKAEKGDKKEWILMALYYIVLGVSSLSQAAAKAAQETEGGGR